MLTETPVTLDECSQWLAKRESAIDELLGDLISAQWRGEDRHEQICTATRNVMIVRDIQQRLEAATATLLAALDGRDAGWLPIESAPRDGSHVLLIAPWWGPPEPLIGRYDASIAGYSWRDARSGSVCEPTHWRPLPAPPARPQLAGEAGK